MLKIKWVRQTCPGFVLHKKMNQLQVILIQLIRYLPVLKNSGKTFDNKLRYNIRHCICIYLPEIKKATWA
jgi:hypothetical protein